MVKTKEKIKAIIFDLNGVVAVDAHWHAVTNAAIKLGEKDRNDFHYRINTKHSKGDIWWKFMTGRISEKEYWKELDKNIKNLKVLTEMKRHIYSLMTPKIKTIEIIKNLKKNYKVALLTNFSKEWMALFKSTREGQDTLKLFEEIINSADVGIKKPDKKIFEVMLKKMNLAPQEVILVDDMENNLVTAKELGIKTIFYKSAKQLKKNLYIYGIDV